MIGLRLGVSAVAEKTAASPFCRRTSNLSHEEGDVVKQLERVVLTAAEAFTTINLARGEVCQQLQRRLDQQLFWDSCGNLDMLEHSTCRRVGSFIFRTMDISQSKSEYVYCGQVPHHPKEDVDRLERLVSMVSLAIQASSGSGSE